MKYMGSKSRIKKYILPILQNIIDKNNIKMYIEPFCGGCNIIDSIKCDIKIANDISTPLIEMWKYLQKNGTKFLPEDVPRIHYCEVREKKTSAYPMWYVGAIGYLASYNGRYFDGGYAKPTIEKGKLRNYYQECKRNIEKQLPLINNIIFSNKNYIEMKDKNNCLIYCDIPYKDTKQYLSSKNFNYNMFWDWCRGQSKNNIVIISELQAPDDFICIWEQDVLRSVKATDKSIAKEKLFIYKDSYQKYIKGDTNEK